MHNEPSLLQELINRVGWEPGGFIMSFIIAGLRLYLDRSQKKVIRILAECTLCGFLTISVSSLIFYLFDWPSIMSVFIGGAIGNLGPTLTREIALKYLQKKVE